MSAVAIRIDLDDALLKAALDSIETLMKDLSDPLESLGAVLLSSTLGRFERGVGPDGVQWRPSSRAIDQGGQTLIDTGLLRSSMVYQTGPDSVRVGSNMVYASIHQEGGQAGRGGKVQIPARPFLGIDAEDRDEIRAIVDDWISEALS
jgi:phage virion morphogenesis protein